VNTPALASSVVLNGSSSLRSHASRDFACGLPLGYASFTPAKRLNIQFSKIEPVSGASQEAFLYKQLLRLVGGICRAGLKGSFFRPYSHFHDSEQIAKMQVGFIFTDGSVARRWGWTAF